MTRAIIFFSGIGLLGFGGYVAYKKYSESVAAKAAAAKAAADKAAADKAAADKEAKQKAAQKAIDDSRNKLAGSMLLWPGLDISNFSYDAAYAQDYVKNIGQIAGTVISFF